MPDIDLQLFVLKELQKFLVQFSEDMKERSEEFNRKVGQLREVGVAVQIAEYFEANFGTLYLRLFQNLITNITDIIFPEICANIAKLEQPLLFRDTAGNIVARKIGDRIWDNSGNWLYEIRGNRIYDSSSNWIFELRGDRVYDTAGNWMYELRGDRIYDSAGNCLGMEY